MLDLNGNSTAERNPTAGLQVAALYALFATLWIFGSDGLVAELVHDGEMVRRLGDFKKWLFVAATSFVLYALVTRIAPRRRQHEKLSVSIRPWLAPFIAGMLLVALLVAAAIAASYQRDRDAAEKRLQAVAELRAELVGEWMSERVARVGFGGNSSIGELLVRWLGNRDAAAHEELTLRIINFYKASNSAVAALVFDRHGGLVAAAGEETGVTPELRAAMERALAGNSVEFTQPSLGDGIMHRELDIVAPLLRSGSPPTGVIVLRLDPKQHLLHTLGRWPVPGRTAGSILIDRDGRLLLDSNAQTANIPIGTELLKGGETIEAHDAAGVAVLAVARPVTGTNWLVVARMDEAEAYANARREALWIAALGAMVVIAWAVSVYLMRERQALQLKHVEAEQHKQSLASMQLAQSIADNSGDAIYAKDRSGRFLLFNREASRAVGRAAETVIGRHDHEIFPAAAAELMKTSDHRVLETGQPLSTEDVLETVDGTRTYLSLKGPLRGPDGEVTGVFGISHDITARLRDERALRDSLELLQAVQDSVLDHMAVLDAAGNILAVNQGWRDYAAQLPAAERLVVPRLGFGASYIAAGAEPGSADWTRAQNGIRSVLEGREAVFAMEYAFNSANCGVQHFMMRVSPLRTSSGGAVVTHSDITERKRTERAVARSEELHRRMVFALAEGIVIFDADAKVIGTNPAAERILGDALAWMQEPSESFACWRPIRPDGTSFEPAEFPLARTLATGTACRDVVMGNPRTGGVVDWLMVSCEPVVDPTSGQLISAVMSFQDFTEKYVVGQQLRKMSLAVEQSPDGVAVTDLQGRIEYANRTFFAATGATGLEELIGRELLEPFTGGRSSTAGSLMWKALRSGQSWKGEFSHRGQDGGVVDEKVFAGPIRQEDGRITHYLYIQQDITEFNRNAAELASHRDHLEEMVRASSSALQKVNQSLADGERFVRAMTENIPAALAYWDRNQRCRFANRQYRERFGLTMESLERMNLLEVLGAELYERLRPAMEGALAGQKFEYTQTIKDANGADAYFWVSLIPDARDGEIDGVFVLASEVTALKRAELELRHANDELMVARDRSEAANHTKRTFLANMSHEIRTPINAIIGFTDLLRQDIDDQVQAKRLDHVAQAAGDLLQLINDILDLSKIESGKLTLELKRFSLGATIGHAKMLVSEQARRKGIAIKVDTAGVPEALIGDPTRLLQALSNLLGNAVKFTERGHVELTARLLEESATEVLLRFEVRDTGIGIAADQMSKLFNAFEQADSSTTRRFGGSGLGLALTRHLAELMGGEVGAQSETGIGSTFWFTARLARSGQALEAADSGFGSLESPEDVQPSGANRQAEETLRREHGKAHVLVVEDNHFNQEVAQAVLQRAGLAVDVAPDGLQAVRMAASQSYDLVLMDLHMPVMDGFDAARALREMPNYRATPILALTANAFGEARAACLEAGMNDHIAKPVSPQRLYEALLRWLPAAGVAAPAAAPAAAGSDGLDRLTGIEGFDPQVGLSLVGGESDAFADLLRRFIVHHEDGLPGLDNCLATGQREQARRLVHSLKGGAAAIGAVAVERKAASLEAALSPGCDTRGLRLAAFDLDYDLVHLVAALHDGLPHQAALAPGAGEARLSRPQLDEALDALTGLLDCGDAGAERLCRDILPDIRAVFGGGCEDLARAVRNHDDERALALLEALRVGARL